jgi:oligopeptidase B
MTTHIGSTLNDDKSTNQAPDPVARMEPVVTVLHGDTFTDDYHWMRNRKDPDLMPFLEGENRFADDNMQDTKALQATLFAEMRSHIKEADETVPSRRHRHVYYKRTEEGKQYLKVCRRKVAAHSPEEILLDIDAMAEGFKFFELNEVEVSPSGNFVAYTVDNTGFRQYTLFVKNLRTGQTSAQIAERVTSMVWSKDNKTIFYSTEDADTKRSNQVYRHKLGQKRHHLVFNETDELFDVSLAATRTGKFILLNLHSFQSAETLYLHSDKPKEAFKVVLARESGIRYSVDDDGEQFLILTNKEAKNFRLVKAPYGTSGAEHWVELVAHRPEVLITGIDVFAKHLVVYEKENGLPKVRIQDHQGGSLKYVTFSEPIFEIEGTEDDNHEFDATSLRLSYQSLVTSPSTYDCDLNTGSLTLLKTKEVPGYDPSQYKVERLFATASDGTKIPMSIVYKGELVLDGSRPCHQYGYGAYGYGIPTSFKSSRLSELDRGVLYVIAHIRGGNELGESWREQGYMRQKMNTFTDFIACAKHLIDNKYTSAKRLVIEGRSAGGLLMGAVLNLNPELFRGAIVGVPFVDVLNTMLDETIPLTTGEFKEWGNPKVKEEYLWMKQYSPYDNLTPRDYPAMLVKSAFWDSQVMYWEPAKYVAKLRAMKTDSNPLLFKMLLEAGGHGGMSGRFDYLLEVAFDQAFLLKQVGILQ